VTDIVTDVVTDIKFQRPQYGSSKQKHTGRYQTRPMKWVHQAGFTPAENAEFFNFSHMIKFANFEFMFVIRDSKLGREGLEHILDTA